MASLGQVLGATVVAPPRTALALVLGIGVLAARVIGQAVEEGERVLTRLNGALRGPSGASPRATASTTPATPP